MFQLLNQSSDYARRIATFLVAATLVASAVVTCADDAAEVEQFLSRLGLVDLQILHLETALDATDDAGARIKLGKRLANLYAERLMTTAEDRARDKDIRQRIDALKKKVPEANTPGLEVMLLQADYTQAEKLFSKWIDDASEADAFENAKTILTRIAPELNGYQKKLSDELAELQAEIDRTENEDEIAVKEKEALRLNGFASRAAFFSGWSNYYFGLTKQDLKGAASDFKTALVGFRKILGLDQDEKYEDIEVDWLGLENIHRANALIGMGLTEVALGNLEGARACFKFLQHVNAPPSLRDHAPYWLLRGLLNAGNLGEAAKYAEEQVKTFAGSGTQGKVAFCVALVRGGFAAAAGSATPQSAHLGSLGVQGLARLGEFGAIRQLMAKHKFELPEDGDFYLKWLKGQQQFGSAEKTKDADEYKMAVETLTAALNDPQASMDVPSAGQCRYELAWCHFRLKEFEKSALNYKQASESLKETNRGKAIDSGWLCFYSYFELAKSNKRFVPSAIDALKTFKRDFPESDQAKRADYFLGKLQQSADSPEDSIRALSQVKPGEPKYLSARADLCLLYHGQWSKVRDDAKKAPAAAEEVYRSADQFLEAARRDTDQDRKLKCILLAVDIAMRSKPLDADKALRYLDLAAPAAKDASPTSSSSAEYRFWRFRLAKHKKDESAIQQHAAWLAQHAKGSVYERSAIITLASAADEAVKSAESSQLRARQTEAAQKFSRLVELVGGSQEAIAGNNNARIANSKAAQYLYEIGLYAEAASKLENLVAAIPKEKSYLRRAGLAQYRAGNPAASLPHWRTLLKGVTKNSEEWYEAKYYQMACLARTDREGAKKVYRQFKLLYPTVKVDAWRQKFNDLDKELSGN